MNTGANTSSALDVVSLPPPSVELLSPQPSLDTADQEEYVDSRPPSSASAYSDRDGELKRLSADHSENSDFKSLASRTSLQSGFQLASPALTAPSLLFAGTGTSEPSRSIASRASSDADPPTQAPNRLINGSISGAFGAHLDSEPGDSTRSSYNQENIAYTPHRQLFRYSQPLSNPEAASMMVPASSNESISFARPIPRVTAESNTSSASIVSSAPSFINNGQIDPRTLTFTSVPTRPTRRPYMASSFWRNTLSTRPPSTPGETDSMTFTSVPTAPTPRQRISTFNEAITLPNIAPLSPMSYNFHFGSRESSLRIVSRAGSIRSMLSSLSSPSSRTSFANSKFNNAIRDLPAGTTSQMPLMQPPRPIFTYEDQMAHRASVNSSALSTSLVDKRTIARSIAPTVSTTSNSTLERTSPTPSSLPGSSFTQGFSSVSGTSFYGSSYLSTSVTDDSRIDETPEDSISMDRRSSVDSFESTESEASVESIASDVETYKYHLMLLHLYRRADRLGWFVNDGSVVHGVSVRVKPKVYETYPDTPELAVWEKAIAALNCEVALKITSETVRTVMLRVPSHWTDIAINSDTRIQILDEISHLGGARRNQFAAFVRSERCLVIWSANVDKLVQNGETLEESLLQYVWSGRAKALSQGNRKNRSKKLMQKPARLGGQQSRLAAIIGGGSETSSLAEGAENFDEDSPNPGVDDGSSAFYDEKDDYYDDKGEYEEEHAEDWQDPDYRPVMQYASLLAGSAIILDICLMSIGLRKLVVESIMDNDWKRWYLAGFLPIIFIVASFFCVCVISSIWKIIGPVNQCQANSSYFSGLRPNKITDAELPSFTIQMPVYKEDLEHVIIPTINSLNSAIETYERQGGLVNIFVNDDGLQLFTPEEQDIRREFYERHNIAWVARPPNGSNGFIRKGRFAKASNMNFALALSLRVEAIMDELRPAGEAALQGRVWRDTDENRLYDVALERAVAETEGRAWVGGNVRIGEFILLIDSDTRVPEDCFLDAASEMRASPQVAIIQHESDVMQVAHHFFENGIAHFTRVINKAISFCVANGEIAPFVGHNAFLRWQAVQEAAFIDEDGNEKIWSESHVSEDFDMALRLQLRNYTIRWATYSNGGFKEGVSLTCTDELNRWQKYAFGCSELMFHPFAQWWRKGPFTALFLRFMTSDLPVHAKFSTFSYITSYYAIGCGFPLTIVGWAIVGLIGDKLDSFYLAPWAVFLTCLIVFSLLTNVAAAVLAFRLNEQAFGDAFLGNFKWVFFFLTFFSGLSYHVMTALLAHPFGISMRWSSTAKEVTMSNFFQEVPAILKRFWTCYLCVFLIAAAMIVFNLKIMPLGYRIVDITAEIPLGFGIAMHFFYPIALNPFILRFSY